MLFLSFCRVYLYNTLQLEKGPLRSFSGCRIESFFVKVRIVPVTLDFLHSVSVLTPDFSPIWCVQFQSAISPDASNIVCGSSDGRARVWKVTFLTFNEIFQVWYLGCSWDVNLTELSKNRLTNLKRNLLSWKVMMGKLLQLTGKLEINHGFSSLWHMMSF